MTDDEYLAQHALLKKDLDRTRKVANGFAPYKELVNMSKGDLIASLLGHQQLLLETEVVVRMLTRQLKTAAIPLDDSHAAMLQEAPEQLLKVLDDLRHVHIRCLHCEKPFKVVSLHTTNDPNDPDFPATFYVFPNHQTCTGPGAQPDPANLEDPR
jgi:hypothetical protein